MELLKLLVHNRLFSHTEFSKSHATLPYLFQYTIGINVIPSLKFVAIYYQSCHDLRIVWLSFGEFLQSLPRKI